MFYCYAKLYDSTCLNTMEHWRHRARAVLTVVAAEIQRFPNLQVHVAETTFLLRMLLLVNLHVLFAWTTPTYGAAIVRFYVNRNAAFGKSSRLTVSNPAFYLMAVFVFQNWCFVVEVSSAKTFVAMILRIHFFTFTVFSPLKLTSRELVDVII